MLQDTKFPLRIFSTGCPNLDQILGGGLYTKEITEFVGGTAVGKTQMCLTAISHIAGVLNSEVLFIDSGSSGCLGRLMQIYNSHGIPRSEDEKRAFLSRIEIYQAFDIFDLVKKLEQYRESPRNQVSLVVIDSFASIVSPVLGGSQFQG